MGACRGPRASSSCVPCSVMRQPSLLPCSAAGASREGGSVCSAAAAPVSARSFPAWGRCAQRVPVPCTGPAVQSVPCRLCAAAVAAGGSVSRVGVPPCSCMGACMAALLMLLGGSEAVRSPPRDGAPSRGARPASAAPTGVGMSQSPCRCKAPVGRHHALHGAGPCSAAWVSVRRRAGAHAVRGAAAVSAARAAGRCGTTPAPARLSVYLHQTVTDSGLAAGGRRETL